MNKETTINLLVSGRAACFRRPEFSDDLVSYDVMPPTIARRLVETALPQNSGQIAIRKIYVINPIRLRWQNIETVRRSCRALVLLDVCYVIEVVVLTSRDCEGCDWLSEITHRFAAPVSAHLGLVDFPATVSLVRGKIPRSALSGTGTIDLGWMVSDLGRGKRGQFRRLSMREGLIDLSDQDQSMHAS
ncbi:MULTISPECIES: CRISPR-associated protein Cas5 [unclassified Sphingomonas]|uniref:CRISPR-associated protein Cas5 n=1 Tax=unclassified Sphingomonas TaxID=196159 RepID=UPI001AD066C4|nr:MULTISPECIES: CRISPR-associated protein Cas5 [unclassified Sphingomonas]MBN8849841.1 CRISPR-associated protein Cas5 [Sphingomonas sp.]